MRADRLINILTTLQARGRATASGLAEENQVSLRTIYCDIDALTMAGIPVYAERGSQGGYRLLNGYKVQLNGMSAEEASALFLSGLGNTATGLGLDAAILRAEKKFAAALPEAKRNDIVQSRRRFHLDAPGWFNESEQPAFLQTVFELAQYRKGARCPSVPLRRIIAGICLIVVAATCRLTTVGVRTILRSDAISKCRTNTIE